MAGAIVVMGRKLPSSRVPRFGRSLYRRAPDASPLAQRHGIVREWFHSDEGSGDDAMGAARRYGDGSRAGGHSQGAGKRFRSAQAAGNVSLALIGGLLGHKSQQTTQRYAHLSDDPLRDAAEKVGARVQRAMEQVAGAKSGAVVPLRLPVK